MLSIYKTSGAILVSYVVFQYIYIDEQQLEVIFIPHFNRGDFFSLRLQ